MAGGAPGAGFYAEVLQRPHYQQSLLTYSWVLGHVAPVISSVNANAWAWELRFEGLCASYRDMSGYARIYGNIGVDDCMQRFLCWIQDSGLRVSVFGFRVQGTMVQQ